ncbi:phage holin family protein [Blastococcus tunisiensis]|uniref:Putative Holin-X, holin superfamily III n=1 Tax=Blastococcus tunisiensis TaxID=1798228 RepID=A0A1I2LR70_9ACTN|nr:phage holin family protein [Blastococcus sp. DSM 46838]SFF79521.1 Putative Holin-X, holin superfamily III [Blastococcus sp. DSM 46838]
MTTPYSGATPAGAASQGYADPNAQNYAADYSGSMGTPTTDAGQPDIEGVSVGQLIGEVSKDLSTLMRQELELAKVELKAEAKKAGTGAGLLGAAGFAGYMVALFLSLALMWALASAMPVGWAGLIVAVLWGVVGAVAGLMGKKKFQQVNPKPERTVETLSKVPGAMKPN